jgi:hypothetical protein
MLLSAQQKAKKRWQQNNPNYNKEHIEKMKRENPEKYARLIAKIEAYQKKNYKRTCKYVCATTCPKCGKHGYKRYSIVTNMRTMHQIVFTEVHHQHTERINGVKKSVYDGVCYLGMGKR